MTGRFSRRSLLRASALTGLAAATGFSASACSAPVPVATKKWWVKLAFQLAANEIGDFLQGQLAEAYRSWTDGARKANHDQVEQGYLNHHATYTHPDLVSIFFPVSRDPGEDGDPMTDRLVVCVADGAVVFEAWAWHALFMYVHYLTDGRKGDDLAVYQYLCRRALVPAQHRPEVSEGTSDSGGVGWLEYRALDDQKVIINRLDTDKGTTATVEAWGIPSHVPGQPIKKTFELPSSAA